MKSFLLQFENLIRREMLFTYDNYSGQLVDQLCVKNNDTFPLCLELADTLLIIDSNDVEINCYTYHIPQTRIVYRLWNCEGMSIRLWSYLGSNLVLVSNDESERSIELKVEPAEVDKPISILSDHILPCKIGRDEIFLAVGNMGDIGRDEIISFMCRAIEKERNIHPLALLRCSDPEKVIAIDKLWSRISLIDKERHIDISQMKDHQYENLIWLQETYLIFGWYRELDFFYDQIKGSGKDQTLHRYKIARNRYQLYLNQIKNQNFRQAGFDENSLLDLYLVIFDSGKIDWKNIVQQRWEEIHFPILRRKIQQNIRNNPDEWIAFMLLANDGDFWWKDKLYEIIRPILDSIGKSELLNFLLQIKAFVKLRFLEKGLLIHPTPYNALTFSLERGVANSSYSRNRRKKDTLSSVKIDQKLNIKIDQNAGFEIFEKDQSIRIIPAVLNTIPVELTLDYADVLFNEYAVNIPLVWNQFAVTLNDCRLRFLRKKNRFQVTIRFKNNRDKIFYNKQEVCIPDNRVAKIYHNISKRTGKIYRWSYNKYGVRATRFSVRDSKVFVTMLAHDVFGVLKKDCNIAHTGHTKYRIGASGNREFQSIKLSSPQEAFTVTSRYCEEESLELAQREGYSDKLFYSTVEELLLRMVVYLNIKDKELLRTVRNSCVNYLNFVPQFADITSLKYRAGVLGIMVDEQCAHEIVVDYKVFSVIKTRENPRINYLYIHTNVAQKLFSEDFFRAYLSGI